ncbi:MAG: lamin tail domain-containing protein [Verrucomicrobiota bacterium]
MKQTTLTLLALASIAASSHAAVLITEVVDGNRIAPDGSAGSGSDPFLAFVEITNTGPTAVSLDGFSIGNFNNGNSTSNFSSAPLSGTLTVGETYYIAYEASGAGNAFETTYGFAANQYSGGKFFNGDDVIILFSTPYGGGGAAVDPANVADVYGVLGTDGSGEDWEYQDTVVSRDPAVTSGTSTFDDSEWFFGAVNLFDGEGAAFHEANTTVSQIPEPTSAFLGGLGLLALLRRRR